MSPTLGQRVEAAGDGGQVTFVTGGAAETVPWPRLHEEARASAAGLQARGVEPGDHVAILGSSSRAVVTAVEATWLAGAAAVMLPLPLRLGSLDEFVGETRARLGHADARLCLVDPLLAGVVGARVGQGPGDPALVCLDDVVPGAGEGAGD
ncbi:MAG: AMP-binding protein, partial [Acidimicrobiales bacterium]